MWMATDHSCLKPDTWISSSQGLAGHVPVYVTFRLRNSMSDGVNIPRVQAQREAVLEVCRLTHQTLDRSEGIRSSKLDR